jgi:hypothetical protein
MKKIIYAFIIILWGCSDDMDGSSSTKATTKILEDESTTLREKLSALTEDNQIWWEESQTQRWAEFDKEGYRYSKFFQGDMLRTDSFITLWYDELNPDRTFPCYRDWSPSKSANNLFILDEEPFFFYWQYEGSPIDWTLRLEDGVLYLDNNSSNQNGGGVFKLITPEQLDLRNEYISALPECL